MSDGESTDEYDEHDPRNKWGDTPAFDVLASFNAKGVSDANAPRQGGHRMEVLTAIREGRTSGPQTDHDHVRTLAAMGFDKETVADALDASTEYVDKIARTEVDRIAEQTKAKIATLKDEGGDE